jgi:hypothetical protein
LHRLRRMAQGFLHSVGDVLGLAGEKSPFHSLTRFCVLKGTGELAGLLLLRRKVFLPVRDFLSHQPEKH